jgi:catechol 2,3-dioxygenase-like lactoylglutathione lyase family enzyme
MDIRVRDLDAALPFYEALMPALGFTRTFHTDETKVWATTMALPGASYFGIIESPQHVPNENRIAFWAASPEEVDRFAELVRNAGATELSGPKEMPYTPGYYAVYFADPSGNRYEIYVRPA